MHLLRVSPSQRSGSSAGSGLGGSTFLCTGRLLGTGDPQGKQRYWGSWEAAKGSELGRCEGLLTSFCTAHSRQGGTGAWAGAGAACPAAASRRRCLHCRGGEKSVMGAESELFGPQWHYSILGKTSARAPGPASPSPAADLGWDEEEEWDLGGG